MRLLCIITLLLSMLIPTPGQAATMDTMEYYIDTDPGVGSGTGLSITAGTSISLDANIPVAGLPPGQHRVYFRVRDVNSAWSVSMSRSFFVIVPEQVLPPFKVTAMEYYIDQDPGVGSGINVPVTANNAINHTFSVDVTSLAVGEHRVYLRVQDENGAWSVSMSRHFYKIALVDNTVPDITYLEYYLDTDPGMGSGTSIPIGPANVVGCEIVIDLTGLALGGHYLYFRAKDANNQWSVPWVHVLTVDPTITDTDGDGIADSWEEQYFGDLATLGTNLDYDGDGYSDLQEYLNSMDALDSDGHIYDPTADNPPGGPGYPEPNENGSFWLLMLPAILSGTQP